MKLTRKIEEAYTPTGRSPGGVYASSIFRGSFIFKGDIFPVFREETLNNVIIYWGILIKYYQDDLLK